MKKNLLLGSFLFFLCGIFLFFVYSPFVNQFVDEKMKFLWSKSTFFKQAQLVIGGDIMLSRGIGRWAKNSGYDRMFS